jgi:hypothetical protein
MRVPVQLVTLKLSRLDSEQLKEGTGFDVHITAAFDFQLCSQNYF